MSKDHKIFAFDTDDFGFLLPGLDELLILKQAIPGFKCTAFTIPLPKEFYHPGNLRHLKVEKMKKWAEMINGYSDWLEIAIHGFSHTEFEMDRNYGQTEILIKAAENLLDKIGLKYKKIFRAPYWQYSYDALVCLRDKGYIVAMDRNKKLTSPEGLKTYTYNWSIEEPVPVFEIIKGHSHTLPRGVKNGLRQCYKNLIKSIPHDATFKFVSEVAEIENAQNNGSKEDNKKGSEVGGDTSDTTKEQTN
jgi:hypothetical protein